MKGILRYLKDYKKESILAPLFKMLEATFELLIPIVMANVIDVGIAGRDISYVVKMCLVMILLGIIGLVCSITAQYFSAKAATGFGTALRNDLFRHITSLSYTEIDNIGTSTLLTRMTSDTNQVQTGVNMVLRLFLRSPFIVFGAMIMSFTIDVKSAMTFVVTIPALSIVVFGVMALSIPLFKKVQNRLDRVTLLTREGLEGARVIRAFNRQDKEFEEFDKSTDDLMKFQLLAGRISAFMNPVTYVIINISTAAIIWIAAGQTDAGIITQGKVVALVNYMSQILVELIKLANLIVTITKAVACAKRINAVMDQQPSITDGSGNDVFGFVFVRQDFFCFANIKLCILDAVSSGIVFRICDGRRHNLYAVNLFCFLCKEQGDGSDAAVEIPYGLFTGQSCVFQCFSVKLFGLYRVDLIKRQRGNAVFDVSDIIFDIILTPDRLDFFSEDHICLLSVDICHDCGHALDLLKPVHQFFNLWNLSAIDHEADHQFFCGKSLADQYVTHQPFSGLFIIWLYFTDFHPRNDFV